MQMTFVVTVRVPDGLEPTVVRNYVKLALLRYDSLLRRNKEIESYFDGIITSVRFSISEIPDAEKDLRSIVNHIAGISKHFEKIEP